MSQLESIKHNVHDVCGKQVVRVQADIDRKVYDYFFHHVIGYSFGSRQAMITWFFQKLYEECLSQGIPPVWDEDIGEKKVVEILNRLNFNGPLPSEVAVAEAPEVKPKRHRKPRLPKGLK